MRVLLSAPLDASSDTTLGEPRRRLKRKGKERKQEENWAHRAEGKWQHQADIQARAMDRSHSRYLPVMDDTVVDSRKYFTRNLDALLML